MIPQAAELLRDTVCVYLRASEKTLCERLAGKTEGRPMLDGTDIRTLLEKRKATYEQAADIVIDTDNLSVNEVADQIISSLSFISLRRS